ncbi:MAG TPA: hypothetical protein VGX50_09545 [Longimicrobium sp.]|jgi:hypothetical protein|nr:hypothetical protein [Longimicrobium sp.]
MARTTPHFGKLKPRYRFALNPIPEVRWSRCPRWDKLTHARKFPLLIHIAELGLLTLGKTCRYCTPCEFIIADQMELEEQLVISCEDRGRPEKIGSPSRRWSARGGRKVSSVISRIWMTCARTHPISSSTSNCSIHARSGRRQSPEPPCLPKA